MNTSDTTDPGLTLDAYVTSERRKASDLACKSTGEAYWAASGRYDIFRALEGELPLPAPVTGDEWLPYGRGMRSALADFARTLANLKR